MPAFRCVSYGRQVRCDTIGQVIIGSLSWVIRLSGDGTSVKKLFTLPRRAWVDFEGVRFYNGESALVVKRWLHRVEADASGLTFVEWDPQEEDLDPHS